MLSLSEAVVGYHKYILNKLFVVKYVNLKKNDKNDNNFIDDYLINLVP